MSYIFETAGRANLDYFMTADFINFELLSEFSYTFTFAFWFTTVMHRHVHKFRHIVVFATAQNNTSLLYITIYYM
jgi:hypothetical protein